MRSKISRISCLASKYLNYMKQPLAYIDPEAKIADNVVIEPFVTIDKNVVIGAGSRIRSNAVILAGTRPTTGPLGKSLGCSFLKSYLV